MTERDQFGPRLRRERERRGISLQDIAAETKISASFFAALERNDFSRWPGGLFRRSFVRSYAQAVGLDAERVVRDFVRLFPPDGDGTHPSEPVGTRESAANRVVHAAATSRERARLPGSVVMLPVGLVLAGAAGAVVGVTLAWPYGLGAAAFGTLGVLAAWWRLGRERLIARSQARVVSDARFATAPVAPPRHVTTRLPAERHPTGRRHRPRRGSGRQPRAHRD